MVTGNAGEGFNRRGAKNRREKNERNVGRNYGMRGMRQTNEGRRIAAEQEGTIIRGAQRLRRPNRNKEKFNRETGEIGERN